MKYLIDASSLYRIVEAKRFDALAGMATLDLARYELGNAVLKDFKFLKKMDATEAGRMIGLLYGVLNAITRITVADGKPVIEVADRFGLSFYDAAYVYQARELDLQLITDDEKLRKKVRGYVTTMDMKGLLGT